MSELYSTSETSDVEPAPDTPVPVDTNTHHYEQPTQSDDPTWYEEDLEGDDYHDRGTLTDEEEGHPTRQEARGQTWGDDLEYHDENDLAAAYDGDADALAAEEEGLPTRQEAREQTWGDHPESYEEDEIVAGHNGDTSTLDAEEEGLPTRQEAWQQTWGDASGDQARDTQDNTSEPENRDASNGDTGNQDAEASSGASDSSVSSRPDMVARYPEDYVRSPEPSPDVTRVHERPETWANEINAPGVGNPGRDNNCGECSRAVDNTWSGSPVTAAALSDRNAGGEPVERMTEWAGTSATQATMTEIGQRLSELGPGSSAIVGCDWKDDPGGHWFNAVNDGGTVKAIDGQRARVAEWPPSNAGFGFDESIMRYSDAIFFAADGKVVKNDHA
jgi:hypothetical protein